MDYRVFSNTGVNTGIYFDDTDDTRRSPVLQRECRTASSSPPIATRVSEQSLLNQYRQESVGSQHSRDTMEHSLGWTVGSDMSQMTAVSDYEHPVCSVRRHPTSQNSHPQIILPRQYETVH